MTSRCKFSSGRNLILAKIYVMVLDMLHSFFWSNYLLVQFDVYKKLVDIKYLIKQVNRKSSKTGLIVVQVYNKK
jgi:hypothetical protein